MLVCCSPPKSLNFQPNLNLTIIITMKGVCNLYVSKTCANCQVSTCAALHQEVPTHCQSTQIVQCLNDYNAPYMNFGQYSTYPHLVRTTPYHKPAATVPTSSPPPPAGPPCQEAAVSITLVRTSIVCVYSSSSGPPLPPMIFPKIQSVQLGTKVNSHTQQRQQLQLDFSTSSIGAVQAENIDNVKCGSSVKFQCVFFRI